MALSGSLPQINLGVPGVTQVGHHSGDERVNPEFRVGSNFRMIPEQYFSGVENVVEFLENMDNNLTYYEIPTQLVCAYLKGHLTGRALDWFEALGYRVVEDKATDYAHKQALSEQFPVEKLIDHIISKLEPQILDYVEVRNPQTTSNVLQIIDKYEERFLNRKIRGIDRKIEGKREVTIDNSRPRREFNRFESQGVANNQRFDGRRRCGQSDHRFHNQGGRQGGSRNSAFRDIHYNPLGHGGEKSFISEEVYHKYFSYRPRQKTKDRVVTAQGAPCCHLGRVELQIRIREFQKTWEFHILNNMQYQCILGIDFMESKLTLDFDQKSLIISDDQIKQLPKGEKPVEIDLSDTKLGEGQKQKLKNLFNGFKGLFSDQPGLTHVLYHEIDTGDKRPVVSRPYRYDRVKQGIIDYHIEKMLQEGKIRPIQSPYASPVFLTRKNNGLPPDSPEAYRFAIDYRKLNAITKYSRYPLPVINYLITNIPHTGVMSTLDLKSGYFQLAINPRDIEKTAFITRKGTFAFLRMPFRGGAKFPKSH
ncbi:retrovirus-related Pol polyprotein from transposon opus [Trichonephila clavipes]|nr:retrovirus-related Pol polyprotein from transposon opus [Trichonephila clavipes]